MNPKEEIKIQFWSKKPGLTMEVQKADFNFEYQEKSTATQYTDEYEKLLFDCSVTIEQMREVDRLMVEEVGVSILMMMENASRNIALLSRRMLGGSVKNKRIVILCGKGNNGGDGLGTARHLINFGADVACFLSTTSSELRTDARVQYTVLKNIEAPIYEPSNSALDSMLTRADLIIDALLGYNIQENPKEPLASLIRSANNADKPVLAVDIPSGLNGDTGEASDSTMRATTTLTLALPKVGLLTDKARDYVGELYVADLSVPEAVYEKLNIHIQNIFEHEEIIKIS